jgi:hypothetical protein
MKDPYGFDPMVLTEEEVLELSKIWEAYNHSTDYGGNPNHHGGPPDWYGEDYTRKSKARVKHDWTPILLVFSTCYSCKHCGAKKEETKEIYCEEEF